MLAADRGRAVAEIPSDRLLTETDGPFTSTHGRPSRPSDVANVIVQLANARSISTALMAETVISNLRALVESTGDQSLIG